MTPRVKRPIRRAGWLEGALVLVVLAILASLAFAGLAAISGPRVVAPPSSSSTCGTICPVRTP